jgi:hypothetical protein
MQRSQGFSEKEEKMAEEAKERLKGLWRYGE